MKIVTTFHQPSSVQASVKCQLSSRDLEHLVVAKSNRLDVYSLQSHGLEHQCGLELRGIVASLKSVPIPGSTRSNLLLLLSHPDPELIFLVYSENSSGSQLTATKQLSLYERTPRSAEYFTDIVVHPSGKVAVVSCYVGKLRVIKFKAGNHEEDFDVVLRELNLLGLEFLPLQEDEYVLAILYVDYQERVQLLARDILLEDLELSSSPSTVLTPTTISNKVVPYPDELNLKLFPVQPQPVDDGDLDNDGFLGGMLVIGGRKILMYELASSQGQAKQMSKRRRLEKKKKSTDAAESEEALSKQEEREGRVRKVQGSVVWPWSEVTAVCAIDLVPRFIIGDSYGRLSLLSLENAKERGLILVPLGEASPANSLTYLTSQTIYLGSHLGDSQLLQVSPTPVSSLSSPTLPIPSDVRTVTTARLSRPSSKKGKSRAVDAEDDLNPTKGTVINSKGSFITVLDTFRNIAPIVDAILVDTDGSGERQVVTCSGGGNRGSLNIVRNGADFQELASVPGLTNVVRVWGIRDEFEDIHDGHILVSTLENTHLLRINDAGGDTTLTYVKDTGFTENSGLVTDIPTLAFGNVARRVVGSSGKPAYQNSQFVVQVTKKGATIYTYDTISRVYERVGSDFEGSEVVAADLNASQVFLAFKGGRLVALTIEDRSFRISIDSTLGQKPNSLEISAISCAPLDPAKPHTNNVVVSYWESKTVEIFNIEPRGFISNVKTPPLPAFARSVLLHDFEPDNDNHRYYLLAGLSDGTVAYFAWKDKQLSDRKVVPLGHVPASLSVCQIDGKRSVFAAGTRATVFSWEKKRLHNSPIMLRDVVTAAPLNTATFQSSLIIVTPTALFIGRVRDLDKLHFRHIPLGLDNPFRLTYEPSLKVFGVGIISNKPNRVGDIQETQSSFRLFDDTTFHFLASYNCEIDEQLTAVASYSPEIDGKSTPVFCVGVHTDKAELEPTEGRILVLSAVPDGGQLKTSSLHLSLLAESDVKGCVYAISFIKDIVVASVNSSVMLFQLQSSDDVLRLVCLTDWNHNYLVTSLATYRDRIIIGDQLNSVSLLEVTDGKIQNLARDYGPRWPVAVEASDGESIIGANFDSNLITFKLTRTLGRPSLECDGHYYLGDFVTKFIRGSLTSDSSMNTNLEATHVFFSSSGRIGVIVEVTDPSLSLHLTALQRNLASALPGLGGESHTRFRAPKNKKGRSDADSTAFGFIDGDFVEQFLSHLSTPDVVEKIMAGHSNPERLTISAEEIQAILENLQSLH
ncbi:hypothetical protein H2248_007410 [Termitomyces sp. 'cryptogamus']|nr:hypothetical protein H2248_007410 [Termitomyces sp. 'cryptogamus']